ncbi:MAG TPA: HAD family phosphatase [Thermodesulfovibrionales bacterium]|nr:HAD family phosphatase [Thermodesulfovibrionales bacterium]
MISAILFDMDGVLVKTEEIKACSYAQAIEQLCPGRAGEEELVAAYGEALGDAFQRNAELCPMISESEIIEVYKEVVGRSRRDVAEALVRRFDLEPALRPKMAELGASEAWEALVDIRMPIYKALLANPETIRKSQWPHNVALLHRVRKEGYRTGLGTMSDRRQTERILEILGLTGYFDVVATIDDVMQGKPDPGIYLLASQRLGVSPAECLVLEDSPSGIRAGIAAGMRVIAVTTPFTRKAVHDADVLDARWVVDDPADLSEVFDRMIQDGEKD